MSKPTVEQWDIFETSWPSDRQYDNPFVDVQLRAKFTNGSVTKGVDGFYDGDGVWRIRFMPETMGIYQFVTESNDPNLDAQSGVFECVQPSAGNKGPVRSSNKHHFAYADGTPFFVLGATVYAWFYRPEAVRTRTLASLEKHGFNKVRMLVFPKHIRGMDAIDLSHEPACYPYEGEKHNFDHYRFNPTYFRAYENRIRELLELGIQADVILFHMYDYGMWGLDQMDDEQALFYLKYMIARLGAFRNVWWSLANEYNILQRSQWRDWDGIGIYLMEHDPYNHLRSIHNWTFGPIYPNRDWMTHVCHQSPNTYSLLLELRQKYGKPVVNDEYEYEGDVPYNWGNSSAELTLHRHWLTAMAGGYGTHGECYIIDGNRRDIFWTYGGEMSGDSAPRLRFLKEIMESLPYHEMEPDLALGFDQDVYCLKKGTECYLYYFRRGYAGKRISFGPEIGGDVEYRTTFYDVWNCEKSESIVLNRPQDVDISVWTALVLEKKVG